MHALEECPCCGSVVPRHELEPEVTAWAVEELFRLDPRIEPKIEVDPETGCWIWTGAQQRSGAKGKNVYGRLSRGGVLWLVHRWVYRLMVGRIPDGHDVHHDCPQTLCCNPSHLEAIDADEHASLHRELDTYAA